MGYSLRQADFDPKKQGWEYNYFSPEVWNAYPFAKEEDLRWFQDAKFGLFLHVGIAAMGMVDISWSRCTHKLPDPESWSGGIPDEVYDGWAKELAFEAFDAKKWAALARESGFQYVVIITKHHDGFHMWDTAYSDYKITNAPFGRDYLRELVNAFRAEGLKIGFYYSQRDWTHPDYEPVPVEDAVRTDAAPYFRMKDGKDWYLTEKHKRYQQYMYNTVRELMTNYGRIDVLWWDADCCCGMYTAEMWNTGEVEAMVRQLQPHIIINNRGSLPGDFDTPEGHTGFFQNTRPWECCMPLGPVWAYSPEPPKSFATILSQFINCAGGSGNYLLSIGCKPDGSIADTDARRMREMGAWLEKYGESVFETSGGIWKPTADYAACFRGNTVYLHILKNGEEIDISLPFVKNRLISVTCMTGETVRAEQDGGRLTVQIRGKTADTVDTVIKLTLEEQAVMEE